MERGEGGAWLDPPRLRSRLHTGRETVPMRFTCVHYTEHGFSLEAYSRPIEGLSPRRGGRA
jgi:hypothetical protein